MMDEVRAYQEAAAKKSDFERTEVAKDKTGVKLLGVQAINPVMTGKSDLYFRLRLVSYGTAQLWRCLPTIPETGNSLRNSAFPLSKS